jgi:phage protein D
MSAVPQMVAGAEVHVSGAPLDVALAQRISEVRVHQNLMLPDSFLIRIADAGLENIDTHPFAVGAAVEVLLAPPAGGTSTSLIKGQVVAVEPEFGHGGVVLAVRGYDQSHALNRTRVTQTYQNMTADDIARKVASRNGLTPGTIDSAGQAYDFVQQNTETDWQFLCRLAARIDFEVIVADRTLHFRHAGPAAGGDPIELRFGDNLQTFRPRVTGVQQVDSVVVRGWDPSAGEVIEATANAPAPSDLDSSIGIARSDIVSALGGGTVTVADRPVFNGAEANALAGSVAARLANAFVDAEGSCVGDPKIRAGGRIDVKGIGTRFGGTYTLSSSEHVLRGQRGYQTNFVVSGRSPRSLVDLMSPAAQRSWGSSIVVGTVTQNSSDPAGLGRVRVKYPALGDDTEGWWARIASVAAGDARGVLMMPQPGDEVLIGFEHGDPRKPYVLGSVWNAKDAPGQDLVRDDGSFALRSDKEITATAKGVITIKSEKDLAIQTDGKIGQTAQGDYTVEGQSVTIKSNGSLTVESTADLTLKGATVSVQAQGTVSVSGAQISLG